MGEDTGGKEEVDGVGLDVFEEFFLEDALLLFMLFLSLVVLVLLMGWIHVGFWLGLLGFGKGEDWWEIEW